MDVNDGRRIKVMQCTLKDFRTMECFYPKEPFSSVVIVPMEDEHDSGYLCMRFVLINNDENVVGVVGGGSDVIYLNGFGGFGYHMKYVDNPKNFGWRIDCLPKSGCLRLFCKEELHLDDWIGSDFNIYA